MKLTNWRKIWEHKLAFAVLLLLPFGVAFGAPITNANDVTVNVELPIVESGSMRAEFDSRGRLSRLASAGGTDFLTPLARSGAYPLWEATLCRTDCFTNTVVAHAGEARSVSVERLAEGVRIVYDCTGAVSRAVCTVLGGTGAKMRWRISVTPTEGWALYETTFPRFRLINSLGPTPADDTFLSGLGHAGLMRNPGAAGNPWQKSFSYGRQPGGLAAQFATFYDSQAGFYSACEDGAGHVKEYRFRSEGIGFSFCWKRFGWSEGQDEQPYDVVTAAFDGTPESPVTWYDAADLYKAWATTQKWCRAPLKERTDLPAWTKNAPAMLAFFTPWIERPNLLLDFLEKDWTVRHPGVPVAAALVGWEKRGEWVSLDYFPMHPSDESTRAMMHDMKRFGAHPWPWPSGHFWSLMKGRKSDGTFTLDQRDDFAARGGPAMACIARDGVSLNTDTPSWLGGGERACLCPGSPVARDFWTREVCLELVKRGADMIQVDQDTGAHVPECWSRAHGHLPGEGLWKTADMRTQFETMLAKAHAINPGMIVTFEEPNEHFNDLLFIQDHRNCRFQSNNVTNDWEWADVFGYLYHEYVAIFQSDVSSGNSFWWAHAAVEGHMPYMRMNLSSVFPQPAFDNGGFEKTYADSDVLVGWNGPENQHVDRTVRHEGRASLRLERRKGNSALVAQTATLSGQALRPGRRLRVGAWAKSERSAAGDGLILLALDAYSRSLGSVKVPFPASGSDWTRIEGDLTVPAGTVSLRLLCWAMGDTKVWLDEVGLDEVTESGVRPVDSGLSQVDYRKFLDEWVRLYHGEGRDWLAHGRHVRPPRFLCARVRYRCNWRGKVSETDMPAVFHSAYESLDGRRAFVFANATDKLQSVAYFHAGTWHRIDVRPLSLRLVKIGKERKENR